MNRPAGRWRRLGSAARAACGCGFAIFVFGYMTLPDVRPLVRTNPERTAFMELRMAEAEAAGRAYKPRKAWVALSKVSRQLTRAVLVAEDAAFWAHDGVDYHEVRASLSRNWATGDLVRGASTITQQLAKNLYLTPTRNPLRKLRELVIARRLEAELSKARILELYLNVIEWGDGVYGVEAASQEYFRLPAASLGSDAAALLAGAIINPRLHSPAHPTRRLLRRQQIILSRMRDDR